MTRLEAKTLLLDRLQNFTGRASSWWESSDQVPEGFPVQGETYSQTAQRNPAVMDYLVQHGCPAMALAAMLGQYEDDVHTLVEEAAGGIGRWFDALLAEQGSPEREEAAANLEINFEDIADKLGLSRD